MGHQFGVDERGEPVDAAVGDAISALSWAAVLRVHLPHGLQSELRRIQGDGPGALRQSEIRPAHLRQPDRSKVGRDIPSQHGLLRLLYGTRDDQSPVRSVVWSAASRAGDKLNPTRDGYGPLDPGCHGRSDVETGANASSRNCGRLLVHGRGSRTQLRGEWPYLAGGAIQGDL